MRLIRNLPLFGTWAPSIVLVATFVCTCVLAQSEVNVLQQVHTVNGIVRFKNSGQPIAGARGRILRKEDTYVVLGSNQAAGTKPKSEYLFTTDKNGRWSVNNLVDGSYVVEVTSGSTDRNRRSGETFATKKQLITVAGADLAEVLIEVSKGARISGTVILEGQPLESLKLYAAKQAPIELTQGVSNSLTLTGPTTMFTMTGIPEGKIELYVFFDTDSHYVKSMSAKGVDLLQEKLDVASGAEIKDVRIVVASDLAEFTGRIVFENGETTPVRVSLDSIGTRRLLGGRLTRRADEQGMFLLRPPPGVYTIEVSNNPRGGGFLTRLKSISNVTFKPGEQKNMEIRIP